MSSQADKRTDIIPVILGGDIGVYALGREFHEAYGVISTVVGTGFIGAISHSRIFSPVVVPALDGPNVLAAVQKIAADYTDKKIVLVANTDPLIETL